MVCVCVCVCVDVRACVCILKVPLCSLVTKAGWIRLFIIVTIIEYLHVVIIFDGQVMWTIHCYTHRIWDIECGACLRLLEGHDDLVR